MPYTEPAWVNKMIAADKARKLSSKDRAALNSLRAGVLLTPEELAADAQSDFDPSTIPAITAELARTKDADARAVLLQELNRVRTVQNSAQPVAPTQPAGLLEIIGEALQNMFSSKRN